MFQNGAEDLRMKSNEMRPIQSPLTSSAPPTPTTPVAFMKGGLPGGLEGLNPTVDMISMLNVQRESVTTADGKNRTIPFKLAPHRLTLVIT